jgi:hypothetical protein
MRLNGLWRQCDDGVIRPILEGSIRCSDGSWEPAEFLVDPAADRTVLSAEALALLGIPHGPTSHRLGGVGGVALSVVLQTAIRLLQEDGTPVVFNGQFAAFTDPAALDMSVLGRDILNLFAVIIDRPGDVICLLGQRHRYVITQQ